MGWFDHWGNGGHMTGNLEESVKDLDDMLSMGHVNIYMFEGGTNFGFMNGDVYKRQGIYCLFTGWLYCHKQYTGSRF